MRGGGRSRFCLESRLEENYMVRSITLGATQQVRIIKAAEVACFSENLFHARACDTILYVVSLHPDCEMTEIDKRESNASTAMPPSHWPCADHASTQYARGVRKGTEPGERPN